MKETYFRELIRRLREEGIETGPPANDHVPVQMEGRTVFYITTGGDVLLLPETAKDPAAGALYDRAGPLAAEVLEYTAAMDQGTPVPGTSTSHRQLAQFRDVILAGRELGGGYGYEFVTWRQNADRQSVYLGHYFRNGWELAKEDFAVRSGLIKSGRMLSVEQLTEAVRTIREALDSNESITQSRANRLEGIYQQISGMIPDLDAKIEDLQALEGGMWGPDSPSF